MATPAAPPATAATVTRTTTSVTTTGQWQLQGSPTVTAANVAEAQAPKVWRRLKTQFVSHVIILRHRVFRS